MNFLNSVGFSFVHMRCSHIHTSFKKNMRISLGDHLINKMKCEIAVTPTKQRCRSRCSRRSISETATYSAIVALIDGTSLQMTIY